MPVALVIITLRQFDYKGSTPYLGIYQGSTICYSPRPLEDYYGEVLLKNVAHTHYLLPVIGSDIAYRRVDLEITFHLLLRIPTHTQISPRIFSTDPLTLNTIPQLTNTYPTIGDFYHQRRPRTKQEIWLWIESWKWWYMTRR